MTKNVSIETNESSDNFLKLPSSNVQNTILLIDDLLNRELLRDMLMKEGMAIDEAENGLQALAMMEVKKPQLILLDLMMPEMDGFELATKIKENPKWQEIPIIIITAKDLTLEDRVRLNGQVTKILQKGAYRQSDLLQEIYEILKKQFNFKID